MKHYELVYIVAGKYSEEEAMTVSGRVTDMITKNGGLITYTQYWERKKLAYPIDHITYGHYVITEFDMKPAGVMAFERALHLSNDTVRHLITAKDTVGSPMKIESAAPVAETASAPLEEVVTAPEIVTVPEPVAVTPEVVVAPEVVAEEQSEEKLAKPVAEETAEKKLKKKDTKVSFDDLDKKLDEILNNDII